MLRVWSNSDRLGRELRHEEKRVIIGQALLGCLRGVGLFALSFLGVAFLALDGIKGTGVSRSSDARKSQSWQRIREFMSETFDRAAATQTWVQKADPLTDRRTLSTAASSVGRTQTDTLVEP